MRPPFFVEADRDGAVEDGGRKIENNFFATARAKALHALFERLKHFLHARQRVGLGNCWSNCDCSSRAHGFADHIARTTPPKIAQNARSHRFKSAPAFRKIQRKAATEGIARPALLLRSSTLRPSPFRSPLPASRPQHGCISSPHVSTDH